jgi:hypothetical protein
LNNSQISASRLITSYALPPQATFTCSPSSTRTRLSKKEVERKTYVSTKGPHFQITLFTDVFQGSASKCSTVSRELEGSEPVVYIGNVTAAGFTGNNSNTPDLLLVKRSGEIQCLDGEKLEEKWTSPASALVRDMAISVTDTIVEYAHLTNAYSASQGILKGRQDVFASFTQEITEDGFNPDILLIRSRSAGTPPVRHIHIVALPRRTSQSDGLKHSVESLLTAKLYSPNGTYDQATFSVQVSAGIIQQLHRNVLTTYDMNGSLPKEISQLKIKGTESFLRLSSTAVMASTRTSITVYNPKYQSVLASVPIGSSTPKSSKRKLQELDQSETAAETHHCHLASYFPKLSTAVAIVDNDLIAVQVEGKSRATGLLIDSLGCSIRESARSLRNVNEPSVVGLMTMESYLPGSIGTTEGPWKDLTQTLNQAVSTGNTVQFDALMADKLGETWYDQATKSLVNGTPTASQKKAMKEAKKAAKEKLDPSEVDRRWVIYALSKIFSWSTEDDGEYRLTIPFYPANVFMWLLKTGNMTVANIESALRNQIRQSDLESIPPGELVKSLIEIDPDMDLLFALISRNYLGAGELLRAIRVLMESLEIFGESTNTKQGLLANGEDSHMENGDIEEEVEALEAEAEADLAMAEYQLGVGSGVRGESLSLALSKLYTCPTNAIVYALQTTLTSQEIVSLIYLLRFEMARGAWTSRYLDEQQLEVIDNDAETPDNSIILISSLLSNCIDAIGAGGWLSGDARLVNGDPFEAEDLISSLKLEISAALEGIEEATYLKGLITEMVRYGESVQGASRPQKSGPETPAGKKQKTAHKPVLLPSTNEDLALLPVGLKAEQLISLLRVGAGGEVTQRSARDIGQLKSRNVAAYSLERIIV